MISVDRALEAVNTLRIPQAVPEAEVQRLLYECLLEHGIRCEREVRLGPRCRIDVLTEDGVGFELKIGRPDRTKLLSQLSRYAASGKINALIAVTQRSVGLPASLSGKPLIEISLNRLWGVAL